MEKGNICVLIMSCDKYDDLWDPFFHFFGKYWPDCPYPVYLATNTKHYERKSLRLIHSNHFGTWSEETAKILHQLPYEYIIYLQDDYFILKRVDNARLAALCAKMEAYGASYLRLFPSPGPDSAFKNDEALGLISPDAPYRTSLQAAIWKRRAFMQALELSENPWQFEANAPARTKEQLFLSVKQQNSGHISTHTYPVTYYYLTAVLRGKWRWGIGRICEQEGIVLDLSRRQIESRREFLFRQLYDGSPRFIKKLIDFSAHRLDRLMTKTG